MCVCVCVCACVLTSHSLFPACSQEGGEVGPIIDAASKARVIGYIERAEANGARILLDGRAWAAKAPGNWVGALIHLCMKVVGVLFMLNGLVLGHSGEMP